MPISKNIFKIISKHPKISPLYANDQTIRVLISKIRTNNVLTFNTAAHVFALQHGVSVFRYLSIEDKKSFSAYQSQKVSQKSITTNTSSKTKKRSLNLPFEIKLVKEAEANRNVYPYIYILENSLRKLIIDKLNTKTGWWYDKKIVPPNIQDYSKRIQDAEKKHKWVGQRGKLPIFYVGLEHLYKIIEINYNPFFNKLFDISMLKTWITECIPIRNLIAHNIPVQKTEIDNVKIRVKYICKLIKSQ